MSMVMTVKQIREYRSCLDRIAELIFCAECNAPRSERASERMARVMAARDLIIKASRELDTACTCSGKGVNHGA